MKGGQHKLRENTHNLRRQSMVFEGDANYSEKI
jgi:hypothetical protein